MQCELTKFIVHALAHLHTNSPIFTLELAYIIISLGIITWLYCMQFIRLIHIYFKLNIYKFSSLVCLRKLCASHRNTCNNYTCIITPLPCWVQEVSQIHLPVPLCTRLVPMLDVNLTLPYLPVSCLLNPHLCSAT